MPEIDESLVQVNARFRGRKPIKRQLQHRTVWDDRRVHHITPDRGVVTYRAEGAIHFHTVTMKKFLGWVMRQLGPEEGSDVK